jgi:para-aminobenzoate synthetase component 1
MSTPPTRGDGSAAAPPVAARWSDWIGSHRFTPSGGLVADAAPHVVPERVFRACGTLAHVLFLDSALADDAVLDERPGAGGAGDGDGDTAPRLGRYSFVAADPLLSLRVETTAGPAAVADLSARVRGLLADLATPTIPGLPPFQGGVAGAISYDYGLARIGLEPPEASLARVPLVSLHVYDLVYAYDHLLGRGWFISQGLPAAGIPARRARARDRLEQWLGRLADPPHPGGAVPAPAPATVPEAAAPHALPAHPGVRSTHTPERYRAMVAAGIEFVRAGDIFQANLAQQFVVDAAVDPRTLAAAAHAINPAPFAGALDIGPAWLVSMSPERFLQVRGRAVRMHPIKGTRRRIASPEADLYAGEDLGASAKDRAENIMIVDLVRNDLARVCTPRSVRVEALCRLERYRYVQHLVSVVSGRLRPGLGPLDAFEAAIPAGSVTGAPKHRACEIISALEGTARGAYCGSLGYVGFDGTADFNLLIRTLVVEPGRVTFAAGGGITAASDPAAEHAESLHKAEGLLRVLAAVRAAAGGGAAR